LLSNDKTMPISPPPRGGISISFRKLCSLANLKMISTAQVIRLLLLYPVLLAASSSHAFEQSSRNWQLTGPKQQSMALSIVNRPDEPGTLTLSVDGHALFERPMRHGELLGVCLDKRTRSPSFIVSDIMEGVGLEQASLLRKDTEWQLLAIPSVEGISRVDEIAGCYRTVSNWTLNGDVINCECDIDDLIKPQVMEEQWHDLLGDYQTGLYLNSLTGQLNPRVIDDTARVETLLAQARADEAIIFDETVNEYQWAIIEQKNGIYGSFSIGMLKQDMHWSVWYYVLGNSKSFNTINDVERLNTNRLSATVCIEGCDWWGKLANVDIGLDTLMIKVNDDE